MKAIILAAGKGTRLKPYIDEPKPLIKINGESIINNIIRILKKKGIFEIGIVVSPSNKHEFIYRGYHIGHTLIVQEEARGIGDAILCSKDFIGNDKFVVVLGDNYFCEDCFKVHEFKNNALTLAKVPDEEAKDYGIAILGNASNTIIDVIEKPDQFLSNSAIMGIYKFTPRIFKSLECIQPSQRGELEITDAIKNMIHAGIHFSYCYVDKDSIIDVGTIERLQKVMNYESL